MVSRFCLALSLALAVFVAPAGAADQPIDAAKVVLQEGKLLFLATDPDLLFPVVGSSDDPSIVGAHLEIFSRSGISFSIHLPGGVGRPGWKAPGAGSYAYLNMNAPAAPSQARSLSLRDGKRLKVVARDIGPLVGGPLGTVGIRITMGSLRNCALFDDATVQRDVTGSFVARNAIATALTDCSDDALLNRPCSETTFPTCDGACAAGSECGTQDLSSCICISEAQPCGSTSPVCNGECPVGDECMPLGGFPLPACGCLPAGSSSCQHSLCGGDCPVGDECNYFEVASPGGSGCTCGPPGPCGSGGDDCPAGYHCGFFPPGGYLCAPD